MIFLNFLQTVYEMPVTNIAHLLAHALFNPGTLRHHKTLNVFGLLTPWNGHGKKFSLAEADCGRLYIASPVTYQVTPNGLRGGLDCEQTFYD